MRKRFNTDFLYSEVGEGYSFSPANDGQWFEINEENTLAVSKDFPGIEHVLVGITVGAEQAVSYKSGAALYEELVTLEGVFMGFTVMLSALNKPLWLVNYVESYGQMLSKWVKDEGNKK